MINPPALFRLKSFMVEEFGHKAALKEFEVLFNKRFPDSLADLQADVSSDFVGVKHEETV